MSFSSGLQGLSQPGREARACFGTKPKFGANVVEHGGKWLSDFPLDGFSISLDYFQF